MCVTESSLMLNFSRIIESRTDTPAFEGGGVCFVLWEDKCITEVEKLIVRMNVDFALNQFISSL